MAIKELADQMSKMLSTLTPREERVLRMRFGIGHKSGHTLQDTAEANSISLERIRQIEANALRKLRHPSRSKRLKPFIPDNDEKDAKPLPDNAPMLEWKLLHPTAGKKE